MACNNTGNERRSKRPSGPVTTYSSGGCRGDTWLYTLNHSHLTQFWRQHFDSCRARSSRARGRHHLEYLRHGVQHDSPYNPPAKNTVEYEAYLGLICESLSPLGKGTLHVNERWTKFVVHVVPTGAKSQISKLSFS
jgi:hypothetical protein